MNPGNLDPQTSQEIMQLFKSLHQKGMTVLMATHDYQMIVKFQGKSLSVRKEKYLKSLPKHNLSSFHIIPIIT